MDSPGQGEVTGGVFLLTCLNCLRLRNSPDRSHVSRLKPGVATLVVDWFDRLLGAPEIRKMQALGWFQRCWPPMQPLSGMRFIPVTAWVQRKVCMMKKMTYRESICP